MSARGPWTSGLCPLSLSARNVLLEVTFVVLTAKEDLDGVTLFSPGANILVLKALIPRKLVTPRLLRHMPRWARTISLVMLPVLVVLFYR